MAQTAVDIADGLAIAQAAYTPGLKWEHQPFFRLLTRMSIPAGGKTIYGKCSIVFQHDLILHISKADLSP